MTDPQPADAPSPAQDGVREAERDRPVRMPLYARLLRLRHLHLGPWQRALLGEGALFAAVLLVLADLATAWTLLVLPLAVAAVVKVHDVVAGLLVRPVVPRR